MINLVLKKKEETFQSNTLDWSSLVKVCLTQSADLSVFVLFFLFFYYSFLFFSTATCVLRFLHYFSTNLDEIWHDDSP